ncbi:formylglycine-generating enzyme family protein [Botrimarina mediterranea]|uniref:formylglycine-generating enzyme family protein n=1 Tax=Botrimarina mediterranea TaxID=2528022 RepID=UPI0018D41084|nr:SUMF1/EgtB/PvdO family nonheme iron enzyme [Botrimarina mediterranea]
MSFDWAVVGNPDNAADPDNGLGTVADTFAVARTNVSNRQYVEFLNAKAMDDQYGLFSSQMMSSSHGGIVRLGDIGSYSYAVKEDALGVQAGRDYSYANKPVVFVTWFNAVRFVNWMHNSQGDGDTESGAYDLTQLPADLSQPFTVSRNSDAKYWLPSLDEWYKAAFHDASAGKSAVYFDFATGSNSVPDSDDPATLDTPNTTNVANFTRYAPGDGYNSGEAMPNRMYPLTDVGAYSETTSSYGAFDMAGNVWEWTETNSVSPSDSVLMGVSGSAWRSDFQVLLSGQPVGIGSSPLSVAIDRGFRVATIPEPTALALAAMLAGWGLMRRQSLMPAPVPQRRDKRYTRKCRCGRLRHSNQRDQPEWVGVVARVGSVEREIQFGVVGVVVGSRIVQEVR